MSYQVLARKWRPQNFKQMVGQQHVLRALINALDHDRLHHAYLFTGTRGVGKTTIARILAKCLNCEAGVSSEPCGECSSCKSIVEGSFVDLIEVDAASRTKVEDTRELLDNVQYAPTRGRFKVYLIDEVHMLTGHSFNALLKTLEEPPPHVKFLFATTDPQKLPVTILSRCLQFNLKRMPVDMISGHLQYLVSEETIQSDAASLKLIARAADGSMRDALSLLDQSIAFGGGELKEDEVREMLGTISHEPLVVLLKSVAAGEGAEIIRQIEDMAGVTPDFEAAADTLIALLHQIAVQQVVPDALQEDESIVQLAQLFSKEDVQLYYQIALQGRRDLPLSPDPRSGFEMLMLRMLAFAPLHQGMALKTEQTQNGGLTEIHQEGIAESKKKTLNRPGESVPRVETGKMMHPADSAQNSVRIHDEPVPPWESLADERVTEACNQQGEQVTCPEKKPDRPKKPVQPIRDLEKVTREQPDISDEWHNIVAELKLTGRAAELIKHCLFEDKENDMILLTLDKSREGLLADSIRREIESALASYFHQSITLKLDVAEVESSNSHLAMPETPAQRSARKVSEKQHIAEQNIATDPFVIELQHRFGATIVPGSVQPK